MFHNLWLYVKIVKEKKGKFYKNAKIPSLLIKGFIIVYYFDRLEWLNL